MSHIVMPVGSVEYLFADVSADQTLISQPVEIGLGTSLTTVTWSTASWIGDVGTTRTARILLDGTLTAGRYLIFVRITDDPETPIVKAGVLTLQVT